MMAVSVDPPEKNRAVMDKAKLAFPILADESRSSTRAFGIMHEKGSPNGTDIPIPAMFLIDRNGVIAWERVAEAVQDRPDPQEVIDAVREAIK